MTQGTPRSGRMYEYYARQNVLPTVANLGDEQALDRYVAGRRRLFEELLMIPLGVFAGARVVEFGPDSGENSLAFARFGSILTLVEPNPKALPKIKSYLETFGVGPQIASVEHADVEGFKTDQTFDIVDAEGFIYTVQPTSLWLDIFNGLLNPGGLLVVNYCERCGSIIETLTKAIHALIKSATGMPSVDAARSVFQAKWDTIPHTRSFESWVMDVLENPFVRRHFFIDAEVLPGLAAQHGFSLHSSWPNYRDPFSVHWHKAAVPEEQRLEADRDFTRRSRLGHFFGHRVFMADPRPEVVLQATKMLHQFSEDIDALIDTPAEPNLLARCSDSLRHIGDVLSNGNILTDDMARARALLASVEECLRLMAQRDVPGLIHFCSTDAVFLKTWGLPYHFAVFRKQG
jgi:predicted O-methyltransferase YrrM